MKRPMTVKAYLEKNVLRQSAIGFVSMALISVAVTFFLSRYKMATDLQKSAVAAAEAFRSRILEGDIKAVENQIHEVLSLKQDETAFVLNPQRQRMYLKIGQNQEVIPSCDTIGFTCFDGYIGPGRIFLPIFFDQKKENLFGYLYLSKSVQIDWLYVAIVFSIFSLGYGAVLLGLGSLARSSSKRLASDVEQWAMRLKKNPKSKSPLAEAPFLELSPLKEAIEGLTKDIEKFEDEAGARAKMLILRGIAHDLLSPVSQVQLYMATLEQQLCLDANSAETLADVKEALHKVSTVAFQVKSLNETHDEQNGINLSEAVRSEIEVLRKSRPLTDKNLRIDLKVADETVEVPMSQTEISRLLQNLIINAANASADGSKITVDVGSKGFDSLLTVADHGHGIPEHLMEKVFEPDFTSKPSTGTGLGLFIVKHICEQKKGSVELSSQPGRGTKATVTIPKLIQTGDPHAI